MAKVEDERLSSGQGSQLRSKLARLNMPISGARSG